MLRLFGGILIFTVSSYIGFHMADRLRKRVSFLRAMSDALAFISAEIEFGHYSLDSIFRRIDSSNALCGFFDYCKNHIHKDGIREAWNNSVEYISDKVFVTDDDIDAVAMLGGELGMTDIKGQKNAISRTILHIDKNAKSAEAEYARLGKTYRSCGMLMGVFFLIIFI